MRELSHHQVFKCSFVGEFRVNSLCLIDWYSDSEHLIHTSADHGLTYYPAMKATLEALDEEMNIVIY